MVQIQYDAEQFAVEVRQIADELTQILISKNADYGNNVDKNIDKWGLASLAQRLDDKLSRFENLIKNGGEGQVESEKLEDTLLDLAGYAILGYRKIRELKKHGFTKSEEFIVKLQDSLKDIQPIVLTTIPRVEDATFHYQVEK